jgi:hypothetical protein
VLFIYIRTTFVHKVPGLSLKTLLEHLFLELFNMRLSRDIKRVSELYGESFCIYYYSKAYEKLGKYSSATLEHADISEKEQAKLCPKVCVSQRTVYLHFLI